MISPFGTIGMYLLLSQRLYELSFSVRIHIDFGPLILQILVWVHRTKLRSPSGVLLIGHRNIKSRVRRRLNSGLRPIIKHITFFRPRKYLWCNRLVFLVRNLHHLVNQTIGLHLLLFLQKLLKPILLILILLGLPLLNRHIPRLWFFLHITFWCFYLGHLFCNCRFFQLLHNLSQTFMVDIWKGLAALDFHCIVYSWVVIDLRYSC